MLLVLKIPFYGVNYSFNCFGFQPAQIYFYSFLLNLIFICIFFFKGIACINYWWQGTCVDEKKQAIFVVFKNSVCIQRLRGVNQHLLCPSVFKVIQWIGSDQQVHEVISQLHADTHTCARIVWIRVCHYNWREIIGMCIIWWLVRDLQMYKSTQVH